MSSNSSIDSCRLCMLYSADMCCLFDNDKTFILNEIEFCTGLSINYEEGLPKNVCEPCLKSLATAYKFKTTCLIADKTFRDILNTTIKVEVVDISFSVKKDESSKKEDDDVADFDNTDDNKVKEVNIAIDKEEDGNYRRETVKREVSKNPRRVKAPGPQKGKQPKRKTIQDAKPRVPKKRRKIDPLVCEICDLKFENKEQAIAHRKAKHLNTDCWLCEICGKAFIHRGAHYLHVKSHLPPEFACDHCEFKTWQKQDLARHLRRHEGLRLYQCEYCRASFFVVSNMRTHIRRVHKGEKRFSCDMCSKRFYDRTKLNRHVDTHNDVKRFECEVCHAQFSRRCYLTKHLLSKHKIVAPPPRPGQKTNFIVN